MASIPFDRLPDAARMWVFAAERPLTAAEASRLLGVVDTFLDQWQAHGEPLTAGRDWRYDRFLMVGVDESAAGASGCSIDALVHSLARVESDLGLSLLDHGPVLFRDANGIERLTRPDFADLARRGAVTPDTVVFDNTRTRVGDVRDGRWETRAGDAWHARAFGLTSS
jgi:hypothetical protein